MSSIDTRWRTRLRISACCVALSLVATAHAFQVVVGPFVETEQRPVAVPKPTGPGMTPHQNAQFRPGTGRP